MSQDAVRELVGAFGLPGALAALGAAFLFGAHGLKAWRGATAPLASNGMMRDGVTRTLALVEQQTGVLLRQQDDLQSVVRVMEEQQVMLRDADGMRKSQYETLAKMTQRIEQVGVSLDRMVGLLTALAANTEHAQADIAAHRVASEQAVSQVAELHSHLLRKGQR